MKPETESVVLLHGMAMHPWTMARIGKVLKADGYNVLNLGYPSRSLPLEELGAAWLPRALEQAGVDSAGKVHFVAHSMGAIVLRYFFRERCPRNVGNVLMLGPPNGGSEVIDGLRSWPIAFRIVGVNGPRLGTDPESAPRRVGPWPAQAGRLGILAGNSPVNPIWSSWLPGPHDGEVTVENAKLEGMTEFHVAPFSHNGLIWRKEALDLVRRFVRTGHFKNE